MERSKANLFSWSPKTFNSVHLFSALREPSRNKGEEDDSVSPSEYLKQILLTTEERTEDLLKPGRKQDLASITGEAKCKSFKALPSVVIFQQYAPGNVYNVAFTVRNVTQISHYLKLSCNLDPTFSIEYRGPAYSTMIAPGLAHVYNVQFTPQEKRDYEYLIKFSTDTDDLTVPVMAIGPRPILDFPDHIEVPTTAAKIASLKPILVRNIGDASAVFTLYADNSCFRIEPSSGIIGVEETVQFTVSFLSHKPGDFDGKLFLKYESGEILRMYLHCTTINCTIRLDRGSIKMNDTYLGMSRSKTLTIHNRSDYVVKYQWMKYKDREEDDEQRRKYEKLFYSARNMEMTRCADLVYYDVCTADVHELVCERICTDEVASLQTENFTYNHASFVLIPEEGEIWPRASVNVTAIFRALEVGETSSTAYLEVTGREDRIPLSLHGTGKGPVFRLNVVTIDMQNIYLCSVHNCEVVAANKGYISGTLAHKDKTTDFGGTIKVTPTSLELAPDECKSFNVSFSSNRKGAFVERIDFVVKESGEILSLHIKGCIVCPTLHFDKESLDFGIISLGFSTRQEVCLHNLSMMPVTFGITVLDDGDQPSLTYEEFAKAQVKPSFPSNPREFVVNPCEGVVAAHSILKIKITYTANVVCTSQSTIKVDMWDSDSDPVTLPIKFGGSVASLIVRPAEITIRFCFINFPYTRSFTVENTSDHDGYFYLVPQLVSENTPTVYSMSSHQGFLKAHQSKTITVTIITKVLGKQKTKLQMLTMGEEHPAACCVITCTGQGPVVSAQPTVLDFGESEVLKEKTMEFSIISDSPIPACFKITTARRNSPWHVIPDSGELEPNATISIQAKLYLKDVGKYADQIIVTVISSRTLFISLTATGVGCSILFEPEIFPCLDLGLLFSHQKISVPITMTNLGTRHHQIAFSNVPELRVQRGQISTLTNTKYQVVPLITEIPPGRTSTVNCKIRWDTNETVLEDWYVFAQIHGQGKRELLGTSTFKVTFTEPQIVFSKKELVFRIDRTPYGDQLQQTDELSVTNTSKLDLNVELNVESPFHLINENDELVEKTRFVLVDLGTTTIRVKFVPKRSDDNLYSQEYRRNLWFDCDEHPNRENIKCFGSVNFPNLHLTPKDITISCELGSSAEKILTMTNNGSVTVLYKFLWIGESIEIERNLCESEIRESLHVNHLNSQRLEVMSDNDSPPAQQLIPPMNSPVSEEIHTQKFRLEDLRVRSTSDVTESEALEISREYIKGVLLPMVEKYFVEDTEIPALESIDLRPPKLEQINRVLNVTPCKGTILPYSSQYLHFAFHGLEPMKVKGSVVCEIVRGPTEIINVFAMSDKIRYSVDKQVIDYGQQLFCETCRSKFTLKNCCSIAFSYRIDNSNFVDKFSGDRLQPNQLVIRPCEGSVDGMASTEMDIFYQPMRLGPFEAEFQLEVGHLVPLPIRAIGVGTFPQIYLCLPRNNIFEEYPAEIGYRAIQALSVEFILDKPLDETRNIDSSPIDSTRTAEELFLTDNDWEIITANDSVPNIMDIDMAIERSIATQFIAENSYVLMEHDTASKKRGIPHLFCPEYVIDMQYLVIGLASHYTATLINYGPWRAEVELKRTSERNELANAGIIVQFKKETNLPVGARTTLHITCHPTEAKYTEKWTELRKKFHLEVTHGCSIPIIIKGIVTYPCVTVNTKHLDFQDVVVGECLMMCLLIENDGLIDCHWEAKLAGCRKRNENEGPFHLRHESDVYFPGQSGVLNVYFKPRKTGFVAAKLNVTTRMGLEKQTVTLEGHGIEHKLRITPSTVSFAPVVPFTTIQEQVLSIENVCQYPVEFFWHHLDSRFEGEDRVANVLARYYQVDEILLPPKKLGEGMPPVLMKFYNGLVNDMAYALTSESLDERESSFQMNHDDPQTQMAMGEDKVPFRTNKKRRKSSVARSPSVMEKSPGRGRRRTRRRSTARESKKHRCRSESVASLSFDSVTKTCPPMLITSSLDFSEQSPPLPTNDPDEIQNLLYCYIEKLQKEDNFHQKMKDPVKDLFDEAESRSNVPENQTEPVKPAKGVCIIFHGAPFTKYQEVACTSARALGVNVLCLDKAITEGIALGETPTSAKLRQIIDDAYVDHLARTEKHREILTNLNSEKLENFDERSKQSANGSPSRSERSGKGLKSPSSHKSLKSLKSPKSPRKIKTQTDDVNREEQEQPRILRPWIEGDAFCEFDKIPDADKLELMDPLSRYEYKIAAIRQLQRILSSHTPSVGSTIRDKLSVKNSERSARKKSDDYFLGIDSVSLNDVLRERLATAEFKKGFVLQSLKNVFIRSDVSALLALLEIIGFVEYCLFVTFLNSLDCYRQKAERLRELAEAKSAEDSVRKSRDIEEMSLSEYEQLPEADKRAYAETTLPTKKREALQRQIQFSERRQELKRKKIHRRPLTSKPSKVKKMQKLNKSRLTEADSRDEKSVASRPTSSKKETGRKKARSRESSRPRKEKMSKEMEEIATLMDDYRSNLDALEDVLRNWDPVKKIVDVKRRGRSRVPKTAKSKASIDTNGETEIEAFDIWYVKSSDPWDTKIYDAIVSQMQKNDLAKNAIPVESAPILDLRPQGYSILFPRRTSKRNTEENGAFQLVTAVPSHDETAVMKRSVKDDVISTSEMRVEDSGMNKRRRRKRNSIKPDDIKSLNASASESKGTIPSILEISPEEAPKPRSILQPHETQIFKIRYQPQNVGSHKKMYALTIANGACISYNIKVDGTADIPRLDMNPHVIFPKVASVKTDDSHEPTYFLDSETFDFGSLLVLRKDKRAHRREAELKFLNVSKIKAEVHFHTSENNSDTFTIRPNKLSILPEQYGVLELTAEATQLGPLVDRLYIRIQNCPQVETIELRSHGSKLNVEVEGKQLFFEPVLLYRRETRVVTIKNKSGVSIFCTVEPEGRTDSQISFLPKAGMIKPWNERKIEFFYHAQSVGVIDGESFVVKVYLHERDEEPILTDSITVSGETYDVAVDIDHANPIDLKSVKVNFPATANFTIKNRGLHEIKYILTLEKNNELIRTASNASINLKKDLEILPAAGVLPPQKLITVQVTIVPRNEITLKECPILICRLVDTNKQDSVVAELPLTVSLTAYYTKFRLYPYPDVNFGTLGICTHNTMYLNVENVGQFPLHYSIHVMPDRHPSVIYMTQIKPEVLVRRKGSGKIDKKSARTEKALTKKESGGISSLRIGPFSLSKIEGDVDPGQTDTLAIDCYPEFAGSQEEEILFVVADSLPNDRSGTRIKLSVNSCVPSVDFHDLDAIFHENHVVNDIQDFVCPNEIGNHTVFSHSAKCLYFRCVSVLSTHATCFKLYNRNIIPADVEVVLLPETLIPKNAKPDTFVVEPRKERIPPAGCKRFTISFTPTVIETYQCTLEASVKLPSHLKDEKLSIKLQGETCVPEVDIVEPPRAKCERAVVNFSRVLVAETNAKRFAFQNVGFVLARVIVEIHEDSAFIFSFSPHPETEQFLHVHEYNCNTSNDRCTVVRLMPQEIARFEIKCRPGEIGKCHGQIRLFIVDNPYENLTIDLVGEGYVETVILEGLELIDTRTNIDSGGRESGQKARRTPSRQRTSLSSISAPPTAVALTYSLDYGSCFVSKMYRRVFKIVNKSPSRCFRFEWSVHPHVVFSPTIGHLKYRSSKELTATFLVAEPMSHANTRLECVIYEIEVSDPMEEVSWDDRQIEVRWKKADSDAATRRTEECETPARKVVQDSVEPDHEIVPGTTKKIQLFLNAVVAYSRYNCTVEEVHFKDTLMFQKREYKFVLSNPGSVTMTFAWKLSMDEQYPIRMTHPGPSGRSREKIQSRPSSRSSRGVLYPIDDFGPETDRSYNRTDEKDNRLKLHRCKPLSAYERTLDFKPQLCSYRYSDLFSSTACLSERSSDSWLEGDDLPFEICPEMGSLEPGESTNCILKFSPMDVFEYKAYLTCKLENLDPNQRELVISIMARSLLPYCHFDVPESDYVSSGRRDPRLPGPIGYKTEAFGLPENTRVIEFNVIGVGETHVKKFCMINPTADDFYFSWKDRTFHAGDEVSNFHCAIPEGFIERGKRIELSFAFLAENVGTFESFWLFSVEKYSLECLFLLVAVVREPSVYCLTVHLKMKPTILGISLKESVGIFNNEEFEIPYKILQESLYSEGRFQKICVSPMCGVLAPKSEKALWIEYHPTLVGEFQFSLQCSVKMMRKPLTIFVTATTFNIIPSIHYIDADDQMIEVHQNRENAIDLGTLMLKQPVTIDFDIRNFGKTAFYYTWDLGMTPEVVSKNAYAVTMPQKQGHVLTESQDTCRLTLTALQKTIIKDHNVTLKISRGPTYRLTLKARARKPSVEFSFTQYNFGPSYVQEVNPLSRTVDLIVKNCEALPIIVESKFEDLPHLSINLDPVSEAIAPDSSVTIPINFRPLEKIKYRETVTFLINSTTEKKITIKGEGIPYKIQLVNPRDKLIVLGDQPVGKLITKKIPILNDGRAPVNLTINLIKHLSSYEEHRQRTKTCSISEISPSDQERASISKAKRSDTIDVALQTGEPDLCDVLTILPSEQVTLQPGKKINVLVKFMSKHRMRSFTAKVGLQTDQTILPLFVLRGSCVGAKFNLNRTYLPFGTVVEGCTSEAKLVLTNAGDIGARFKWNTTKLPTDFNIFPMSGYCSPGMDVNFGVSFRPSRQNCTFEGHAVIEIEKYTPFNVKIIGGCRKLPDPIDTLSFSTNVRTKQTKFVNVVNDTFVPWKLKPEVSGEFFDAAESLTIDAQSSASCLVVYTPFVMNDSDSPHKGTLLLKLPEDRSPLLYSLHGLSLKPEPLAKIVRRFPAKTRYTELLPVYNWTNVQQKFSCAVERVNEPKQSSQKNPIYDFSGNSKMDVPANSQRNYKVVFHAYEESNFDFKVTFTARDGEYQFYEINYVVTEAEVVEAIKLTTNVRIPTCHTLRLDNPLEIRSIEYTAECHHPYVVLHEMPKLVRPLSKETVTVEYCPLLTSEEELVRLMVSCPELGRFPYDLRLKANPSPPEKLIRVNAVLGSTTTFSICLRNLSGTSANFALKVDHDSLICPKSIEIQGMSEGSIDVSYEPSNIEDITANLTATSNVAGEYVFPIIGTHSLPKPQGPYIISANAPAIIPFKNMFKQAKTFELTVDVPEVFNVLSVIENVKPKQSVNILVSLKQSSRQEDLLSDNQYPVTGKLAVCPTDPKLSHVCWIYYLRGITE